LIEGSKYNWEYLNFIRTMILVNCEFTSHG
jgi:hypothetical protein